VGYSGKLEEKKLALKLRGEGCSYSEIQKKVPVYKSTLSYWCRDVILTQAQMERLRKKKLEGSERGRFIGSKILQERRVRETRRVIEEGIKEVGELNKRDRFVAGVALYLGDGYKNDKSVGFSNANPEIIRFMMSWFRKFGKVPEEKFRGQIWIHDNLNERKAKRFWSELTRIPINQFHKSYIAENKVNSKKIRKNINEYGVFAIRISNSWLQRKIMGWLSGVLGTKLI